MAKVASKKVVLYACSGCAMCDAAKEYLSRNGIRYTEKNVSRDDQAAREVAALGGTQLPVIIIGKEVITTFDRSRVEKALGLPPT